MSETGAESAVGFKTGKYDDLVTSLALATYMGSLLGDRTLRTWVIEEVIYDLCKKEATEPLFEKRNVDLKDKVTLKIVYDKTLKEIEK